MSCPIVVGNWKMHGDGRWLATLAGIAEAAAAAPQIDVALCVPATLIHRAASLCPNLAIGGQDCHRASEGAFTGAVSAGMLAEAGARLVIVGHSERRCAGDDDAVVAAKMAAANHAGLRAILCVGEDAAARARGDAVAVACRQLLAGLERSDRALVVAYEPVWAIGRGLPPTLEEIAPVIAALRATLAAHGRSDVPILYGGSVIARAVPALMAEGMVAGLLVGQASLAADAFTDIVEAVRRVRCAG